MLPQLQKPQITEIQVRMDCNGCVQKIKKALNGINGIYDIYINIPDQKLTIIGWADPEKIVKAIKKTRKTATICSHTTPTGSEPAPEGDGTVGGDGGALAQDPANPAPEEDEPPPEKTPPVEPTPAPEVAAGQSRDSTGRPPVEEVQVVYRYPPDRQNDGRVYSGRVDRYPGSQGGPGFRNEPTQPLNVNHSYNMYKPTPYVTEYEYIHPPPEYTYYTRPEPPQSARYSRTEPLHHSQTEMEMPQHYSHSEPPQPHSHSEPTPQHHSRSEPTPQHHSHSEPTPQHQGRSEPPPQHQGRSEPPPQHQGHSEPPQHNRSEPPQHNRSEPPRQYARYSRSEPPQHYSYYSHPEPSRQQYSYYSRSEPPRQQYSYYSRSEPPPQHSYYSRPEPPQEYSYYSQPEPPEYMHYNGDYPRSNRNGNIPSIFSDEDPNGCRIA